MRTAATLGLVCGLAGGPLRADAAERFAPISLVGNVTTPTLLITGEVDYRTPISETEQYYQALKLRKVPAAMVRIPDASHGIQKRPSNLIAKVAHILGWFERYGSPREAPAAP